MAARGRFSGLDGQSPPGPCRYPPSHAVPSFRGLHLLVSSVPVHRATRVNTGWSSSVKGRGYNVPGVGVFGLPQPSSRPHPSCSCHRHTWCPGEPSVPPLPALCRGGDFGWGLCKQEESEHSQKCGFPAASGAWRGRLVVVIVAWRRGNPSLI